MLLVDCEVFVDRKGRGKHGIHRGTRIWEHEDEGANRSCGEGLLNVVIVLGGKESKATASASQTGLVYSEKGRNQPVDTVPIESHCCFAHKLTISAQAHLRVRDKHYLPVDGEDGEKEEGGGGEFIHNANLDGIFRRILGKRRASELCQGEVTREATECYEGNNATDELRRHLCKERRQV